MLQNSFDIGIRSLSDFTSKAILPKRRSRIMKRTPWKIFLICVEPVATEEEASEEQFESLALGMN